MDLLSCIEIRKWKNRILRGFKCLAFVLPLATLAPSARAAVVPVVNVTIAWDASTSPNVTNYNIYYGLSSGSYANKAVAGNSTSVVISNLVVGTTYYFVATSVANNGLESAHSAEFVYAPVLPRVGARLQINVSPTRQVTLSGSGPAGYAYDVFWSSNATAWTRFTNVTVNASGTFALKDPAAATKPMSFYRLQQASPTSATAVSAQFQVNVSPAGQVTLNGTGPAGYSYDAYWSSDALTWTKFTSLTVSAAGTFAVQDPTAATQPMRFYRLEQTSPTSAAAVSAKFQVDVSPAGQVTLNGTGPAGYTYDAYWSSDAVTWTKFASLTVSPAGTFAVRDPTSATQPMRFYRLTQTSP